MFQITMANWDTDEIKSWQEDAHRQQNELYATYGDRVWWSGNPKTDENQLNHVIGFAMFGPAPFPGQSNITLSGYQKKQFKHIKNITFTINHHFKNLTFIMAIFICAKSSNKVKNITVFKVWDNEKELFIDTSPSRTYKSWDCFLKENTCSKYYLCYPKNGRYELNLNDVVNVDYGLTPAFNIVNRITKLIDIIFFLLGLAGMIIVSVISENEIDAFVVLVIGAIIFGVAGVYFLGRCMYQVYDNWKHF